jgi:starch synthase
MVLAADNRVLARSDGSAWSRARRSRVEQRLCGAEATHRCQAAAERSGKALVLILCGRTPNEDVEAIYLAGAATYAPDVRIIRVDSRDDATRRQAWAAGDIFISLADGIQETFGLTPVEAMAAGLPVVVSDYDGYRDTVRDGVDGFRIASFAPEPGSAGRTYALRQELNIISYNEYCLRVATATSIDLGQLTDRLTVLAQQPDLRRRLGAAGKARARELYDWRHVFRQYQSLWADLNARRAAAAKDPAEIAWLTAAPKTSPARLDPFRSFAHYPTTLIGADTPVALAPGVTLDTYRARAADDLFSGAVVPEAVVLPIWTLLEPGPATLATLARAANLSVGWATTLIGALAKMGLVSWGRLGDVRPCRVRPG